MCRECDEEDKNKAEVALKQSGVWEKISSFPDKGDTVLTREFEKDGIGLSGGFFYASCVLYLLCAIIRLAYFNVDEAQRQKNETGKRKSYYGLPVTTAALLFPMIFGLESVLKGAMPVIYQIALFGCAAAFVLKFKLPKAGKKGIPLLVIFGIAITVLVISSGLK
jgi:phosphatidylserine synthase